VRRHRWLSALIAAVVIVPVPAVAAKRSSPPAVSPEAQHQLNDAVARLQTSQRRRRASASRTRSSRQNRRYAAQTDREALQTAATEAPGLFAPQETRLLTPRPGEKVEAYLGDNAARIDVPDSTADVIANSTLPLRVGEGADKRPVDLELVARGDAFGPRAAIVPVSFPHALQAGLDVGSGITMRLVGADRQAVSQRHGQQVFYGNALRDTDVFATPLPTGTETFAQLRSAASPRRLLWSFDLPVGARLVEVPAVAGSPAHVEIQTHNAVLVLVLPAVASDANDQNVPVKMSVDGNQLVLDVNAPENTAYPVLVDPVLENNFAGGNANSTSGTTSDVLGWIPESNVALSQFVFSPGSNGITGGQCLRSNLSKPGGIEYLNNVLCVTSTPTPNNYGGQSLGQYAWRPPSGLRRLGDDFPVNTDAYVYRADVRNSWLYVGGNGALYASLLSGRTHAYIGSSGPAPGQAASENGGPIRANPFVLDNPSTISNSSFLRTYCIDSTCREDLTDPNVDGTSFLFGLRAISTNVRASAIFQGAVLYVSDRTRPAATHGAAFDQAVWRNSGSLTSTVNAADAGVGLQRLGVYNTSGQAIQEVPSRPEDRCQGDRLKPCPKTFSQSFTYPVSALPDGANALYGLAVDALGKVAPATADTLLTARVDRKAPDITPSGSLTGHSPLVPLTDASYTLHINASDGDSSIARSGVVSATVSVSNLTGPPDTQTLTNPTCQPGGKGCSTTGLSADYNYVVSASKPGLHTVTITAIDSAGNTSSPATTFSFLTVAPLVLDTSALGLERYYQYDSTPTGPGSTAYVNVANGNLVWQVGLFNDRGRGLNTFGTLTYNDQQPLSGLGLLTGAGSYNQVGQGFSLAVSGITRVNEPLAIDQLLGRITLTDADGTQHVFQGDAASGSVSLAGIGLLPTRYFAPPGVHLRLRRFNTSGPRTWAATRPDGVTYYFDAGGYATSIQDRNANTLQYAYQYALPLQSQLPALLQGVAGLTCDLTSGAIMGISGLLQMTLATLNISVPVCTPQLTRGSDAAGRPVTMSYTAAGKIDAITEHGDGRPAAQCATPPLDQGCGHVTKFAYDAGGTLLQSVTSAWGTADARSHRFAYSSAQGLSTHRDLLAICDPRSPQDQSCSTTTSHTTTIAYSGQRDLLTAGSPATGIKDRNDHATTYTYLNSLGQHFGQAVVTDARAHNTTYTLDAASRPTAIVDALARRTELVWTAANDVMSSTRAKGTTDEATTDYTFNQNGLLLTKIDPLTPDGQRHTTTLRYFDSAGNQLSSVAGGETTADAVSDLRSITTPRGSVADDTYTTDFDYGTDARGNLLKVTEPLSRNALTGNEARGVINATYDATGQVLSQTDETGNTTTYPSYDANGLPLVRIDPRGTKAQAQGGDPNAGRWLYSYDPVGNLLTTTDPRGATSSDPTSARAGTRFTTSYSYDSLERLVTAELPRLSDTASQRFVHRRWIYDANDNPTTYADAVGYAALTGTAADATSPAAYHTDYNAMDQPATQRTPAVTHAGETAAAPEVTELGYDEADNLTSVKAPNAAGSDAQGNPFPTGAYTTALSYDAADQRTTVTRQQVTSAATKQLVTSMAYDNRGNVMAVADPAHNAAPACKSLTPAAAAATVSCQRDQMTYDKADNLLHSIEDPSGLRLDTARSYLEDDAPKSTTDPRGNTTSYAYDERGQKLSLTNAAGDQTSWLYDLAGRLAKLTKPNGTATPGTDGDYQTVYTYDPDGYLTDESVPRASGQNGSSSWAMHYVRNGVGDATTITDARGHSFDNTYFDTGELHTTGRPSMYEFSGPAAPDGTPQPNATASGAATAGGDAEINQLSYDELVEQAGTPEAPLPSSPGQGSFGSVAPVPIPGLMPRAGAATFDYDNEMRLVSARDVHPTTNTLGRDAVGRISTITQPLSDTDQITRAWTYDRDGNVVTFDTGDRDANNVKAMTTYGYDQFDRLSSATTPGSGDNGLETTSWAYDDNDNQRTTTTPLGHVATLGYDAVDRLVSQQDATGKLMAYGYDAASNRTSTVTPRGMTLPVAQRGPYTTTSTYNPADELATVTDGLGNTTTYTYDADGNQIGVVAPGSPNHSGGSDVARHTDRTFDGRDLPWTETANDGRDTATSARTTLTEYDANGNLRRTVNPSGYSSTIPADDGESPVGTTSSANRDATVREYDTNDLLTHVDQPKGAPSATSNDDHLFRTDYTYTNAGFIQTVSLPHDVTAPEPALSTTYIHNDNGWIASSSDPVHLTADSTAAIQKLTYAYDRRGNQTSWVRDARRESNGTIVEPSRSISRTFSADGVLTERTATRGTSQERAYAYKYDADGRLTSTRENDPSRMGANETFSYDDADRLRTANDSARGTDTVLTYDIEGLVGTRQTDGTLSGSTYTGGKTTTLTYDALDRQQKLEVNPSDGPNRVTNYDYWNSGDQKRKTDPNLVKHEDYYDAAGQLIDRERLKGASTVATQTYSYDRNQNRTRDEKGTETYNSRNQLINWARPGTAGNVTYVLNGAGAVLRTIDSAGPDTVNTLDGDRLTHAVTTTGSTSATSDYRYDGFGNLLSVERQGQPTVTYTFDAFERLTSASDPAKSPDPTTYSYDGLDRRDKKLEASETTTYGYLAASNDLTVESTAVDNKRSYDYDALGSRQGQQVIAPAPTPTIYRAYVTDAQGGVQGLEDPSGALTSGNEYQYDPFGTPQNTTSLSQAAQGNPFRFQGFYYDPTAGGYNELAREYRPDIQRFLTQDRFEAAGGDLQLATNPLSSDRYAYVAGNPTTNAEYDGHLPNDFTDNSILHGNPSKPPAHRQRIGGFNLATPAPGAPYTLARHQRAVLAVAAANEATRRLDASAAHGTPPSHDPCGISVTCKIGRYAVTTVEDTAVAGYHLLRCNERVRSATRSTPDYCGGEQIVLDSLTVLAAVAGGAAGKLADAIALKALEQAGVRLSGQVTAKAGEEGADLTMAGRRLGHTFTKHGVDNTEQLLLQAAGSGQPVGQFLDDAAAERFIAAHVNQLGQGARSFDAPEGLGRIVHPDGTFTPATRVRLVPSGSGVKTAYPEP
jgi:RHS repeat-associated protein